MKMLLALFIASSFSSTLYAISEENYAREYKEKIIPFMREFVHGTFVGEKKIQIHFATYANNPAGSRCLVILPGRTEALEKYSEVVYDLDQGALKGELNYFLMDHRGQGTSGRMLNKETIDSEKGHIDDFANYALDVKTFLETVVKRSECRTTYLLAHSLGAGIGVDFLQKYPLYFSRAALVSPMLKINTAPYPYAVAGGVVWANRLVGKGNEFGIKQGPYNPTRRFEVNTFTTSPVRYEMAMGMYDMLPAARLGGVTNRWITEVMQGTKRMRAHYDDIKIPLHVFQAGIETYSLPTEMEKFCREVANCQRSFYETSKHEVLMDRDVNRSQALKELEEFFQ